MKVSLVTATSLAALALPATAAAHNRGPAVALDYRLRVDEVARGVSARVLDGDRSLRLAVAGGVRVVVLGYLGEPVLRFDVRGVVIASHPFAARRADEIGRLRWDLAVIDEAHRLRNAYRPDHKTGQALRKALRRDRLLRPYGPVR